MSSVLHEMGLDPEDFEWSDLALCKGLDTETFYAKYETDEESAKAADAACLLCPVVKDCFFAGSKGEHGVWGGIYWNGSGKPDKNKNSHKTEQDWDAIYDRVGGK
jgi:hypothetical protein